MCLYVLTMVLMGEESIRRALASSDHIKLLINSDHNEALLNMKQKTADFRHISKDNRRTVLL